MAPPLHILRSTVTELIPRLNLFGSKYYNGEIILLFRETAIYVVTERDTGLSETLVFAASVERLTLGIGGLTCRQN